VGSSWWQDGGVDGPAILAELDDADVALGVVVQAVGVYGHDCRCAAATVATAPDRLALVASVDLDGPDPLQAVTELAGMGPRLAGVRLFGVAGDREAPPAWLSDGRAGAVVEAVAELGAAVVPCLFPVALPALAALAADHPHVLMALDHCGFPDLDPTDPWRSFAAVREVPSIACKVTSYVLEAAERDDGDPAPTLERLVEQVGADRLCWGSDHPQDQRHTYEGKLALLERAARHLDAAARATVTEHTARRLFFPSPTP
jgi:predicted TIM-barrel fold metal-dependent hydrolase